LGTREFNALLTFGCNGQLKNAKLKPLVPNAKTVNVPEQNFDPVAPTIKEQEQMARQWILVERLLGHTHQTIKAESHVDGRRANEDSQVGKICHDIGFLLVCRPVTAWITAIITAWPTPTGSRTNPPLGNSISTGDDVTETGRNFGSAMSANVSFFSSCTASGIPSLSR
jgi:hypothetical protein